MAAPKNNLPAGIAGAVAGALVGAVVWAVLVSVTDYKIGFAAVGVGALSGYLAGQLGGVHPALPVLAGIIGLLGCVIGDLLIDAHAVGAYERQHGSSLTDRTVLKEMLKDPSGLGWAIYKNGFEALDALFYALAALFGFRLATAVGQQAVAAGTAQPPLPAPPSAWPPGPASPGGPADGPVDLTKPTDDGHAHDHGHSGHEGHDHPH